MSGKNLMNDKLPPVHPGEILKEEFMRPNGLTANQLALRLQVPTGRITLILNGRRAITPDTALRLSKFFGTTAEFWMNLQQFFELELAREASSAQIDESIRPFVK